MNAADLRDRLRQLREAKHLTQGDMAARLQTYGLDHATQQRVADVECGHIRPEWGAIRFLALALEADPNAMLRWQVFLQERRNR
jgi:transcriptional regulator with XRE-family HTH domain